MTFRLDLQARLRPRRGLHHQDAASPTRPPMPRPILAVAAAVPRARRSAVAVFPELCAVRLRDRRSAAAGRAARRRRRRRVATHRRGLARPAAGAAGRRAAAPWRAALQLRASRSIAARCSASCPRSTCRTTASSTSTAISPPGAAREGEEIARRRRSRRRSAPTCCSRPRTCRASWSMPRSARICGCRCRRAASAALAGRHRAGQPVGQQHHHRQGRHAAPALPVAIGALPRGLSLRRRRRGRIDHRSRLGRPGLDLRERRDPGRDRALPGRRPDRGRRHRPRPAAPGARPAGHLRRQPPRLGPAPRATSGRIAVPARSADCAMSASSARIERFPFVPADPDRLAQDCYEAYNIQVSGLVQRLQAIGIERVVIGVSGGLDSTQALIVAAKAFDLLGLPRTNILAYTMPGFATGERHQGATRTALMPALGVTAHELDIRPAATQMLTRPRPPVRRGEPRLRRHLRERAGGPAHRLPVPPRQPPRRHRARHRRPVANWRSAGAPTASATRCRTTTSTPACRRR